MISIKFSTANDAFNDYENEVTEILVRCLRHVRESSGTDFEHVLTDSNGNIVGHIEIRRN